MFDYRRIIAPPKIAVILSFQHNPPVLFYGANGPILPDCTKDPNLLRTPERGPAMVRPPGSVCFRVDFGPSFLPTFGIYVLVNFY